MNKDKIGVFIVDDSILFRHTIANMLTEEGSIEVVGMANDPIEAIDKIEKLKPDVITLDVEMPKMSGIEFLKQLLPKHPIPVVMVSSISSSVFDALNAGAVDFVAKPNNWAKTGVEFFGNELITKIKIASIVKMAKKSKLVSKPSVFSGHNNTFNKATEKIIAIGASTGGTEAILGVLCALPKEMPGIVVVLHMPPTFTKMYAERLNTVCKMDVKEAEDGEFILPGKVLIAPGGMHMAVAKKGDFPIVRCFEGEKVNGHCPSVDILFDSVSETMGKDSVGVLLTGMGRDGAAGLLNMKTKGAHTIVQDEKTCVVYGMPKEAVKIGAADRILPLGKIADYIIQTL
ncbi:MAG: Chemotaxis response regulator protein-glutamate methylesterase [Firmicutes bacterium ADurb.Bin193]|nr:MAG: Chemotaxis response regulator protein-glutamate methylesterase [Firmicutes bacterium ADurb.Bin193]